VVYTRADIYMNTVMSRLVWDHWLDTLE